MKIEKSTQIARPLVEVFAYLKQTKNQDNFSVWNMTDPTMNKKYLGTDGTVGFIYRWDSTNKNVGAGEQEITLIEEGKRIVYEIRFLRPMKNVAKGYFIFSPVGNGGTSLSWIFDSPSVFPFSLLSPIFKRMLGKDMEKGLANLKGILEKHE